MKLTLKGGFYQARSVIADAQRCVNLFPEMNPQEDAKSSVTTYPTPGLTYQSVAPNNLPERCCYTGSDNQLYKVHGVTVYLVSATFTWYAIGNLTTSSGPVSICDNGLDGGNQAIVVDGSIVGFRFTLGDKTGSSWQQITDAGFFGGTKVDFADGYFIINQPETQQWYISDNNASTFTMVPNFASKEGAQDILVTLAVMHREVWLFGSRTTDVYYNAGTADFPYAIMPGVFMQQGCMAPYSVARFDVKLFWLGQENSGRCVVFMGMSYNAVRISTHPIEDVLTSYETVYDAIGSIHQLEGHPFYVLTFPTANATWVYDLATSIWHERAYIDANGNENAVLPFFYTNVYNAIYCGDRTNGNLYTLDPQAFDDNGAPIARIRSFPTMDDDVRIIYDKLVLDMTAGQPMVGSTAGNYSNPTVSLRWSDDGGNTWGQAVQILLGAAGQYQTRPTLWRMGYGRRRVYECSWSAPADIALNGAWMEFRKAAS